jgi:hypothetical protein
MPITIGTVSSNVKILDQPGSLDEEMIERLVTLVLARLNREMHAREQLQDESAVRDRMSEPD